MFARGALEAALWARGRKPGLYSMADVLGSFRRLIATEGLSNMDRMLVLVRHGQSEWNLKNLFTGWKDPDLTPKGVEEAQGAPASELKALGLSSTSPSPRR